MPQYKEKMLCEYRFSTAQFPSYSLLQIKYPPQVTAYLNSDCLTD